MPSRDFTSEDLFSSRMMSMHSSTHSSQMKTVGPAMSFLTSCWLLPQNEQYRVFFESPPALLMGLYYSSKTGILKPVRSPLPDGFRRHPRGRDRGSGRNATRLRITARYRTQ